MSKSITTSFVGSTAVKLPLDLDFDRYSSLDRLVRVTSWCYGFIHRTGHEPEPPHINVTFTMAVAGAEVTISELSPRSSARLSKFWYSRPRELSLEEKPTQKYSVDSWLARSCQAQTH